MTAERPFIVGLGGTGRPQSSSERVLRMVLERCGLYGAETQVFDGAALDMPMYAHGAPLSPKSEALIESLRRADGIVISSPGYHGSVSGLIKNALDYTEEMSKDARVYFEGRAVGLIAVAAGWQATGTTLATLRAITHALRGWPTPMAVAVNSMQPIFDPEGRLSDEGLSQQMQTLARQVVGFARMRALHELAQASATEEQPFPIT